MPDQQALATFLRAGRDLLKPADVGLAEGERRRVAGLRREEVAMLAGISAEYYLRLEQGRERQPSDQVLEGLAGALQLGDDATQYMRNLARPAPRRRRRASAEKVEPGLQTLIDSWHLTPAYVQSRHMTVLIANPMARALSPYFAPGRGARPHTNNRLSQLLRMEFYEILRGESEPFHIKKRDFHAMRSRGVAARSAFRTA